MDFYAEMVNIAKIRDGLFIGDVIAGTTLDIILEFKISHMINTCSSQIPSQFSSIGIKYLNLPWPEHPSLNLPLLKDELVNKICNFIDSCLRNGDGLMIYSSKGQNRCCVVILIYLMKKYFWSLQKSKEYLLSKKQDMKISKNFLEHLLGYENHLHKIYPNRIKSTTWSTKNLKDGEELLMSNTYLNEVEISKKKILQNFNKKDSNKHIGWADKKENKNNGEIKLVNYNIEEDLFLKKDIKDITCHIGNKELKSINKISNKDKEIDMNNKEENIDEININNDEVKEEENKNRESISEINISNNYENSNRKNNNNNDNNKMKLNILKEMPSKNIKNKINNTGGEDQKLKLEFPLKEFTNKNNMNNINNLNKMNINFNDINIPNFNQKYYNNFIEHNNNIKNNNNKYSLYLKNSHNNNKQHRKARSSSKNNNNNLVPFIEYNQNNNIITNIMINHANNNGKLFVKFNKENQGLNNHNIINNNNQFIQNNNFININYFPQANDNNIIPSINNYNPLLKKNKKNNFGNAYNNINIISGSNRQNNFMLKRTNNKNNYDRFNINNYESSKPIKLLNNSQGHKKSISIDKSSKIQGNNYNYLYNQQYMIKSSTNKNANSVDLKRPSTAPQKYKISKNKKTNILGIQKMMPNTYSNGFYSKQQQQQYNNKRLPSPMVSGNQKFGFQKLKLKNYKTPNTTLNLNFFDKKGF